MLKNEIEKKNQIEKEGKKSELTELTDKTYVLSKL